MTHYTSDPPRDENGIKFRAYRSSTNASMYSIGCFVYPSGLTPRGMDFLEQHRNETVDRAHGKLESDQAITYQGYPARLFTYSTFLQGTKMVSIVQTVVAGQYFYVLQISFPLATVDMDLLSAKKLRWFFDSLVIDTN